MEKCLGSHNNTLIVQEITRYEIGAMCVCGGGGGGGRDLGEGIHTITYP